MTAAEVSPLVDEEAVYWLALRMTPGLGTRKSVQLLDAIGSPRSIFESSAATLTAAGLPSSVAQSIASGCAFDDAVTQQSKIAAAGVQLIPIHDERYPPRLREIYDPPPMLFARGRVELLSTLMLAVVGTRRPTAYGTAASARLSTDLAAAGLTIVSGMARGIDTAAHKAVLESGGNTVAVFGSGVDTIYPAENRKLSEQIAEKGLLLSEFPMGAPPYPQNFPVRNRIVSGMSCGVLIVEGAEYSGSAITARLALQQDREVFAVPGNITSKASWGPNLLIKQGAKLVQDWNDVFVDLPAEDRRRLVALCKEKTPAEVQESLDLEPPRDDVKRLLAIIPQDIPAVLDTIVDKSGQSAAEVLALLFEMEMSGMIKQLPGKQFVRAW